MFDGCSVACFGFGDEVKTLSALASAAATSPVQMSVKGWPLLHDSDATLPRTVLRSCPARCIEHRREPHGGCLPTAFLALCPEYASRIPIHDGPPMHVCQLNAMLRATVVHDGTAPRATRVSAGDALSVKDTRPKLLLCHQALAGRGHFFALLTNESGEIQIMDDAADGFDVYVPQEPFVTLARKTSGITYYESMAPPA